MQRRDRSQNKVNYSQFYDDDDFFELPKKRKQKRSQDEDEWGQKISKKEYDNQLPGLLAWRDEIKIIKDKNNNGIMVNLKQKDVKKEDLSNHCKHARGVFINISWKSNQNKQGFTINEFKQLNIQSYKFIQKGILFIWCDKDYLGQVLDTMYEKGFQYIENFAVLYLSKKQIMEKLKENNSIKQEVENFQDFLPDISSTNINQFILQEKQRFSLKSSRKTLLMFKKDCKDPSIQLELRHQRTPDVVFGVGDSIQEVEDKLQEYVYGMIETLLPNKGNSKTPTLCEIYGNKKRNGWVTINIKK